MPRTQPKNTLSKVIMKMLSNEQCMKHNKPIQFLKTSENILGCQTCKSIENSECIGLQEILDNPILIMTSSEIRFREFHGLIKNFENVGKIKNGFIVMIEDIRRKIDNYCDEILDKVNSEFNCFIETANCQLQYIKSVQNQYRQHFQVLASQILQQGTQKQLLQLINKFKQRNQNPSDALSTKMQLIQQKAYDIPKIDWSYLQGLYKKVVDPILWSKQRIIHSNQYKSKGQNYFSQKQNNEPLFACLLPEIKNTLQNSLYALVYDNRRLVLMANDFDQSSCRQPLDSFENPQDSLEYNTSQLHNNNNNEQQILSQISASHDDYYQLDQYRILGISYNQITLYSYAFEKLVKVREYNVVGCTEVLSFSECLILIASNRLIRLWIDDGAQEVLGFGFESLQYFPQKFSYFICKDSQQKFHIRSVKHSLINLEKQ